MAVKLNTASAVQEFERHLTARKFEDYIAQLESIPGKAGTLELFFTQQKNQWHTAVDILQPESATADAISVAINKRVVELTTVTNEVFNHIAVGTTDGWMELLNIIRQHIPSETLQGYFIKPDVLREYLLSHPPTNILTYLGYQSIEQCLKKESLFEILAALRFAESEAWMKSYLEQYELLGSDSFEYRPVEFMLLSPEKWWKLAEPFAVKKKHHFSHLKEVGVVFSYPGPNQLNNAHYLHIFIMMILHYIFEVKFYSNFFEHNIQKYSNIEAQKNFGHVFIEILQGDKNICAPDRNHLPIIQQYHLKKPNPDPCVFEPHVMPEVLHWHKAADVFFQIVSKHLKYELFSFWNSCYTVGSYVDQQLLTLNFPDNILSHDTPLVYHYKEDLWNTLFSQYFSETILEQAIINDFAEKVINLNTLIATHYGQASSQISSQVSYK